MKYSRGFTLIETFGAITILILAVIGPLTLLSASISDSALLKDQITASHLAQEAIELVINKRDSNVHNAKDRVDGWLAGLGACIGSGNSCNLEVPIIGSGARDQVSDAKACGTSPNPCSLMVDSTGLYKEYDGSSQASRFSREIKIEPFNTIDEVEVSAASRKYFSDFEGAKVTVTIKWNFKLLPKQYTLSTIIYNPVVRYTDTASDSGN